MKPSRVVVHIQLLVWLWTGCTMASLFLTFFRELVNTYATVFLGSAVMLPVLTMAALFQGPASISLAMFLHILISASEAGFLLYNAVQATSGQPFAPTDNALLPFVMLMVLAGIRMCLAIYICSKLGAIRTVPFEERCRVKPHTP